MESFDKLLQYAIAKEEEAASLYEFLAAESAQANIRDLFVRFAGDERGHKKAFAKIVGDGCRLKKEYEPAAAAASLSVYLVDVPFDPRMSYQDALILAMKREEKSMGFYREMALKVADPCLAETLQRLAGEEEKHKSRLEEIYERDVLTDD